MKAEKILAGLVRIGIVTDVNAVKRRVRVKFQDVNMISGWLYVLRRSGGDVTVAPDGGHTHSIRDTYTGGGTASTIPNHNHSGTVTASWMPKINDTVLVLYLPVEQGDGFVLGGI